MKNFLPVIILACIFFFPLKIDATTHTVLVSSNEFTPSILNVTVGDTVKWQWVDGFHTTTCDPGIDPVTSLPAGAATWNSPMDPGNPMFSYVVMVAGTYHYVCLPHSPSMEGTINASGGSTVLLTENFDYPAGDSLQQHGWTLHSGTTGPWLVVSPGLTYSTYPLSGIGNAAKNDSANGFQDINKNFPEQTSGSVYVAFMVNVHSVNATGDYFLHLGNTSLGSTFRCKVFAKSDGGSGFYFGVSKSNNVATAMFEATSRTFNTTYLVVAKYTFGTGPDDDASSLYVFTGALPGTEPGSPTIGPDISGTDLLNAGTIALRQGTFANFPRITIDGIQISTIWTDIVTNINPVSVSQVADDFMLYQNYPNPFNPSTTISFAIPQSGFVDLKIYNVLGKEVASLVNNNMLQGTYNVNFNAGNLNSGVYFYRLNVRTNDGNFFTDSKKLLLVK